MIRHIVMFKIKDEYKDEIPQLVKNFYGMKGRIEGMLELEAGADILHNERSYDLALVTLFENREDVPLGSTPNAVFPFAHLSHLIYVTSSSPYL